MTVTLTFFGAAGTVTGSCYLLEHAGGRLLVDCGMFQGSKSLRQLNYNHFPFDPAAIDAVVLTHAHIDHSGLLPKLCRLGYRGRIFTTAATHDLLTYMLPDSGAIQESDVQRLNKRNAQRGAPQVEPIYTRDDAEASLKQIADVEYKNWASPMKGVRARWWNAGHILGSASIELEIADGERPLRMLFSGDIGPGARALQGEPQGPTGFDTLVMESTYGGKDRIERSDEERRAILRKEIMGALQRGGNLLIPAFAVERTQELLVDLGNLFDTGGLPNIPVFLDSPLAARATEVFRAHADELPGAGPHGERLARPNFHIAETVEQSKAIARINRGAIIIAGGGMCDGGRIRHHLKANLWKPDCTVMLIGYQAPGTLGQILLSGAPAVRIHGEEIVVKAEIRSIDIYSGHADHGQLVAWARARLADAPRAFQGRVFLTHGEPDSLNALRQGLIDIGVEAGRVTIPEMDQQVELAPGREPAARPSRPRLAPRRAARTDWHNSYADLLMSLPRRLRALPDDEAREALLQRLRGEISGADRPEGPGKAGQAQ